MGVVSILLAFQKNTSDKNLNLVKEEITLKGNILSMKRTRTNTIDYRFWTNEHSNRFRILKGSISRNKRKELEDIKDGAPLTAYLSLNHSNLLSKSNEDVTLRGLYVKGAPIFTPDEYINNRTKYHHRLSLLGVFIGAMFLINGIFCIPFRTNLILALLSVLTFLFLRYFELWLY